MGKNSIFNKDNFLMRKKGLLIVKRAILGV